MQSAKNLRSYSSDTHREQSLPVTKLQGTLSCAMSVIWLLLFMTLAATFVVSQYCSREAWKEYKYKFDKYYPSDEEDRLRFNIYCGNKLRVDAHNAKYERGQVSYRQELNELSDMTEEEIENGK
nr:digestive cysteine proteinase 1-like [Dermacentor andersoni]